MWIGYHLTPWIAYLSDRPYRNFLLVPGYVDKGLVFSALSMIGFMVGGSLQRLPKLAAFADLKEKLSKPLRLKWVLVALVLSLGTLFIEIGGPGELFYSSHARGEGQFAERLDWTAKATQMVNVAKPLTDLALAVCCANLLLAARSTLSRVGIAAIGIAVAMMASLWNFSRTAGWPLLVLAAYAFAVRNRRKWTIAVTCCGVAAGLSWVGYNGRGQTNTGLANFVQVSLHARELSAVINSKSTHSMDYPFDAMSPWTRKAALSDEEAPEAFSAFYTLAQQVNPVPSELVKPSPMGIDLSVAMGTAGTTAITTPALGEVYWVGGFTALWIPLVFGILCNKLEAVAARTPALFGWFMRCVCYLSLPVSLHQGVRGATRPFVYCFFGYLLWLVFGAHRKLKSIKWIPSQRSREVWLSSRT
jgi:hypothetical protein